MIIIGVTGSIGMGKTTIASMLRFLKIPVFDSDEAVKNVLESKKIIEKVYKIWPDTVNLSQKQKKINKIALSDKIFNEKNNRKLLESIIHPIVEKERKLFLINNKLAKIVGLDVPLLYETSTDKTCDYVFLVNSSKKKQKRRVLKRLNMTEEKFNLINNSQWKFEKKKMKQPYVINTSYGLMYSFITVLFYLSIIMIREKFK